VNIKELSFFVFRRNYWIDKLPFGIHLFAKGMKNRLFVQHIDGNRYIRYNLLRAKYYIHNKLHILKTLIMFFRPLYIIKRLAYKKGRNFKIERRNVL